MVTHDDSTYLRRQTQSVLTGRLPQARKSISDLLNKTPTRSPFTQGNSFTVSMNTREIQLPTYHPWQKLIFLNLQRLYH